MYRTSLYQCICLNVCVRLEVQSRKFDNSYNRCFSYWQPLAVAHYLALSLSLALLSWSVGHMGQVERQSLARDHT